MFVTALLAAAAALWVKPAFGLPHPVKSMPPELLIDVTPEKVLGYQTCAKCHAGEVNTWRNTPHAANYEELHRKPKAKEIAKKMGVRSMKRDGLCVQCHYTQQQDGRREKVISGVSCESCHGAARDWITVHNDYGGAGATKASESPEHARGRVLMAIERGMRNPNNLYLLAKSCFDCHTTPHEELVNKGGHAAGSEGFELVSWSQGQIRHNFLRTGGSVNGPSSQERLRVMYVVGLMTELEYSLRAVALATRKGTFGVQAAKRAAEARKKLAKAQLLIAQPKVQTALDAFDPHLLRPNNATELNAAADVIAIAAYEFADEAPGAAIAGVDPLLPPPSSYK